ncbi:unnamed protein product [Discula destructiva]
MGVHSFIKSASLLTLALKSTSALRIIQSNDDGWAEMYVRDFHISLTGAGYDALLSAPADDESATSSLEQEPTIRDTPCEYDSCAPGAAFGTDAKDNHLNWVNSYPATAMRYGFDKFAPAVWGAGLAPELAITGPNVGSNVGFLQVEFSGTVGGACHAVEQGVPAIAFSGTTSDRRAFNAQSSPASLVYADLATNLTGALVASGAPYLPADVFLNVNFAGVTGECSGTDDFSFVLSRINIPSVLSKGDVQTCGNEWLPWEKDVMGAGCYVSISVGQCSDKTDAVATAQKVVLDKLGGMLTCLPTP